MKRFILFLLLLLSISVFISCESTDINEDINGIDKEEIQEEGER